MLFFWLANYLLSGVGLFLWQLYGDETAWIWPCLLVLGVLCAWIGYLRSQDDGGRNQQSHSWLALLPVAAGMVAFAYPYSMPLYLYAAGLVLWLKMRPRLLRSLAAALLLAGLITGIQSALVVIYFKIAARAHEANLMTPIFYMACKALGVSCGYSQDTIFVQTSQEVLSLVTTWEKLGLFFVLSFFSGGLVLHWNMSDRKGILPQLRWASALFVIVLAYAMIRYLLLALAFIDFKRAEIYWNPIITLSTFVLLPLASWKALLLSERPGVCIPCLSVKRKAVYFGIAAMVFMGSLACLSWFRDPGRLKQGRILIDEYYSNWEWTNRKLDTAWYGVQSVYNYYCLHDYLSHFYEVSTLREPMSENNLSAFDVLIIKTPTRAFSSSEIQKIAGFVKKGGGLFLIGDHTNVFGTSTNLNPLADVFGIRFHADATYDLRTSDLHLHEHNVIFRHPVIAHMPFFLYATSCTLEAPLLAEDIMTATGLKAMHLDYSRGGFFPDKLKEHNYMFGLFLQSIGLRHGDGRVIAFADSTCFSNFYMHLPGKPEYSLGVCNWLNRTNRYAVPVRGLSVAIMACSALLMVMLLPRRQTVKDPGSSTTMSLLLCWGLLGIAVGAVLCNLGAKIVFGQPVPRRPLRMVGFENKYCDLRLPDRQLVHNPEIDYHTFYVWTQRLGYIPQVFSLNDQDISKYETIVMINPIRTLSADDKKRIERYVSGGGRLLVIDHPLGKGSKANEMLAIFGLRIKHEGYAVDASLHENGRTVGILPGCAPIEGGTPLLHMEDGRVAAAFGQMGAGMLAAIACSPSFANSSMGETETVPNEQQQFLYRLEFWLLQCLMRNRFGSFYQAFQ